MTKLLIALIGAVVIFTASTISYKTQSKKDGLLFEWKYPILFSLGWFAGVYLIDFVTSL